MKLFFDFKGRASRSEFWGTHLIVVLFAIIINHLVTSIPFLDNKIYYSFSESIYDVVSPILDVISYLLIAILLIPLIAIISVTVRRFHDLGKSGSMYFYFLIPNFIAIFIRISLPQLIPLAAILVLGTTVFYLIYISQKSQQGINEYGPNPKSEVEKNLKNLNELKEKIDKKKPPKL